MKKSSLLGQFVSYYENGVLWIRSQVPKAIVTKPFFLVTNKLECFAEEKKVL